jgi:hypothetical protein
VVFQSSLVVDRIVGRTRALVVVASLVYAASAVAQTVSWPSSRFWSDIRWTWAAGLFLLVLAWQALSVAKEAARARTEASRARTMAVKERSQRVAEQSMFWLVYGVCQRLGVELNSVTATLWRVPSDARQPLTCALRFGSGLHNESTWTRGKGVLGTAWSSGEEVIADLAPLRTMTASQFASLDENSRLGLTWQELRSPSRYRSVWVIPVREADHLLGLMSLSVAGTGESLVTVAQDRLVSGLLAVEMLNCRELLRVAAPAAESNLTSVPACLEKLPAARRSAATRAEVTAEKVGELGTTLIVRRKTSGITPEAARYLRDVGAASLCP